MLSTTLGHSRASVDGGLVVFESLQFDLLSRQSITVMGRQEKRSCPLEARLMLTLVVALALLRDLSIPHVFKQLLEWWFPCGRRDPRLFGVSDEAILKAKGRLGVDVVRHLFESIAGSFEVPSTFHGLRVLAMDGTAVPVADTKPNEKAFGRRTTGVGDRVAFPELSIMALVAADSHHVLDASIGCCYQDERKVCRDFLSRLSGRDLVLMDRGFYSAWLCREFLQSRVHFVMRIPCNINAVVMHQVKKGDYIVIVRGQRAPRGLGVKQRIARTEKDGKISVPLRLIEYRIGSRPIVRLVTDLHEDQYSAEELARLYSSRWEAELVFDEVKTHLAAPPRGAVKLTFRSKSPEPILQEAYGLLIAHNLVRSLASLAAVQARVSALAISFTGALRAIRRCAPNLRSASAQDRPACYSDLLIDIGLEAMRRWRRNRHYPRVVRVKIVRTPRKQPHHRQRRECLSDKLRLVKRPITIGSPL